MLQCKLNVKAEEVSLSIEDGWNYGLVKGEIMQAYELVPETYH